MNSTLFNNPVLPGWNADPELHYFHGRYWIYPTHSAPYEEQTYFEAWSSPDLNNWTCEGKILDFKNVPWSTNRAAWAPTIAELHGTYYLIFGAGDGAGLGLAGSHHPAGPFQDLLGRPLISKYYSGAQPIDAHLFPDDDGKIYLYWGGWRHCVVGELTRDLRSLKQPPPKEITPENYVEGPFMLKRHGLYYLMWSEGSWGDSTYGVAYGIANNPYGPFPRKGVVLRSGGKIGEGAGHHSVLKMPDANDEYVIAYHRRVIGDSNPHHRIVCIDRMHFASDGSILPVEIT